jgi:hypothetical protein
MHNYAPQKAFRADGIRELREESSARQPLAFPFCFILTGLVFTFLSLFSCDVESCLDNTGLKREVAAFQKDFNPGSPELLEKYLEAKSLEEWTRPDKGTPRLLEPSHRWKRQLMNGVGEWKLTFPVQTPGSGDVVTALFYVFGKGPLKESKVILWIPGKGMSDLAFRFIRRFIDAETALGWTVVLYVPPYHLDRALPGKKDGEGFFTADTLGNLRNYALGLKELRTVRQLLEEEGVRLQGAWGGSMGASWMFHLQNEQPFDHLCAMIPLLDWKSFFLDSKLMDPLICRLAETGFSRELLAKAYGSISFTNMQPGSVPAERTLFLLAAKDLIASPETARRAARSAGVSRVLAYPRSHGTILAEGRMYKDYAAFLEQLH